MASRRYAVTSVIENENIYRQFMKCPDMVDTSAHIIGVAVAKQD